MEPVVKDFWSNLSLIGIIFLIVWLLGLILQPIVIALIITIIMIIWKAPKLWCGIKYYWNELWSRINLAKN